MRVRLAGVLLAVLATPALADRKIDQLAKSFERETRVCGKNLRGITVVLERGRPVAANDPELASDLDELAKAHAIVKTHCDDVASMLAFLLGASSETYKTIQKEFDERDQKIRAERISSRQAITDAQPLIQRAVPRTNKRVVADASASVATRKAIPAETDRPPETAAEKAPTKPQEPVDKPGGTTPPPPVKKPFATFRSGRTVELPRPEQAWTLAGSADLDVAMYAFAAHKGVVTTRAYVGAPSCDHVLASAKLLERSATTVEPSVELKALRPAWVITWRHGTAEFGATCLANGASVVVGTIESSDGITPALDTMLANMLAVRLARR